MFEKLMSVIREGRLSSGLSGICEYLIGLNQSLDRISELKKEGNYKQAKIQLEGVTHFFNIAKPTTHIRKSPNDITMHEPFYNFVFKAYSDEINQLEREIKGISSTN